MNKKQIEKIISDWLEEFTFTKEKEGNFHVEWDNFEDLINIFDKALNIKGK